MNKSELEKVLTYGIFGTPELHPDERRMFMGEMRERVIDAFTLRQLGDNHGEQALLRALSHQQARELLLRTDLPNAMSDRLRTLAYNNGRHARLVGNIEHNDWLAAVVVADTAVEPPPASFTAESEN